MIRAGPLVELGVLHEREADTHDDPAAELARGGLGIDDAAAVIGAEHAVDAGLAGDRADADLAEDRAEGVHRVGLRLLRVGGGGDDGQLVTARASQDLRVALPAARVGELAQPLVAAPDLVGGQPGQGRFVAGEREQLLDERALGGDHRAGDGGRLRGAPGEQAAGERGVAVGDGHPLQRQAEPLGGDDRLGRRGPHPHVVGRHLDRRVAGLVEPDPRGAAGEAVVGIGRARAARADQPFALPARARRRPSLPAEALGARAPRLDEVTGGERQARARVLLGLVADPQLDRVQIELDRELVDRRLQREGADRLPGRAHERVGEHVHVDDLLVGLQGLGRVHVPRRERELLGERVVRGHRGDAGVDQRREAAVVIGADRDSLLGVRATADQPVDALARERDPHGTPGELGRGSREQMV